MSTDYPAQIRTGDFDPSGYYAPPEEQLDPRVIARGKVRPELRRRLLTALYDFWGTRYVDPHRWSRAWLAGSALAWQWSGRGTPDLDVLIGVDRVKFIDANPNFEGWTDAQIAGWLTDELKSGLDPLTANMVVPGTATVPSQVFEATYYVNPAAADIRAINPYAAYDLTSDEWTVKPDRPPQDWDPRKQFPAEWWSFVDSEIESVHKLVDRYNDLASQISTAAGPARVSLEAHLGSVIEQGSALFDDVHKSRRQSFSPGGGGYYGYENFRWQAHKHYGTVDPLHALATLRATASQQRQSELYGATIADPTKAIIAAMRSQQR